MIKKSIYYFSPTGNTKFVADNLAKKMELSHTYIHPLEFVDAEKLTDDEHIIILFSIHGFNPPRTVLRFVNRIPEGYNKRVSLIAVGCTDSWINGAVSSGLRKILNIKGYKVFVDMVLAMPLTFIVKFPNDIVHEQLNNLEVKLCEISKAITDGQTDKKSVLFKSKVIHLLGKVEDFAARFFGLELYANKHCNSCGICIANCSEKNIRFNKKKRPIFSLKCIMCLRCVYNCPDGAIKPRTARFIPIKGGYSLNNYLKSPID